MINNYTLNKEVAVTGKLLKEKLKNNPNIILISNDSEEGRFKFTSDLLEDEKWYEVYNDMGTFEVTEIRFINNINEFDEWL